MPRRQTDGRHTQTETQHASPCPILTLQHWENTKHNPLFFCQSSQTYSFRSISSIHNHQPRSSQPFQVPGRRGPDMPLPPHNRRANYKGSSNKWALCGVSKTHGGGGGEESALYLATTTTTNPPHPTPTNHPTLNKNNLRGSAVGTPGPEREKRLWNEGERSGDASMSRTCHHRVSLTRCRMCSIMKRCVEKRLFKKIRRLVLAVHSLKSQCTFMNNRLKQEGISCFWYFPKKNYVVLGRKS